MLETVSYIGKRTDGIKLQLLHILEHTPLAESYRAGELRVLEQSEYCALVADAVALLPERVVIHRMTGDGAKRDLLAPLWSGDKKRVLSELNRELRARGLFPQN